MIRHRLYDRTDDPDARLVLVLHGGPGAPGTMAPVARGLEQHFRVAEPFERRSGGRALTVATHVEGLDRLIEALAPRAGPAPALVGSSWGAMLALAYAAAHPERAGPLVLVGCGTFDAAARAEYERRVQARLGPELRAHLERLERELDDPDERLAAVGRALLPAYSVDPLGGAGALELEACDARGHRETWADALRLQAEGVHPAAFAAVRSPVLMLHGAQDPHPGPAIRDGLARHLGRLEYVGLEACGHYPWLERGARERFFRTLLEWLGRAPGRTLSTA